MFVQHKELRSLQVAAEKISHLHSASSSVQLAFAGYPPQLCHAYLIQIFSSDKVLIVVAFYLAESDCSIFFVPKFGELPVSDADRAYEEGYSFVESMGFVLTETDYHLLSQPKKITYWSALPICKQPRAVKPKKPAATIQADKELEVLRLRSKKSLGRFLAAM